MATDDDFLDVLRATFRVEAAEHLQTIATGLLAIERGSGQEVSRESIETVYRAAHSLKGAARAADFVAIESLCESLEDALAVWRRQTAAPSAEALDSMHHTLDAIAAELGAPQAAPPAPRDASGVRQARPAARPPARRPAYSPAAAGAEPRAPSVSPPGHPEAGSPAEETVRLAVAKLDVRLREAEEMLTAKLATRRQLDDLRQLALQFDAWKKEWRTIEPDARALRQVVERPADGGAGDPLRARVVAVLDFLDWTLEYVRTVESRVAAVTAAARQDHHSVGKLVDDLLDNTKQLLLLPFGTLAGPLPKLVRDLCRDQGKEADVILQGEHVEMDKRILEQMKAPLIHMLRNAVDHGIEPPGQRSREGKPPRGTIIISASQVNGHRVEIAVTDDGAGVNVAKVKASAVDQGVLSGDNAGQLGDAQARRLVFQSDVSTSPIVTRLSGRGLGLAIVRETAERLGGTVAVHAHAPYGTRFSVVLPSTLATFRGVLVEAAGRPFVLPTSQIERVAAIRPDEIRTVEGRDTIPTNGRAVALVRLADVLELPEAEVADASAGSSVMLVLGGGDERVAFAVDAVLDEQEVLVKPLCKPLSRVRNVAGATVLSSGRVVPVLNVGDLLKSTRAVRRPAAAASGRARPEPAVAKSILVAEDSITSRMLIKNILESAGYRVKTAVDGAEAFTLLRAERFDLVVSDVEMPRQNGFELTARIRGDRQLAKLPVILVTALEASEQRERGIDVGADAYIVKSGFDQARLLDAVRRLI